MLEITKRIEVEVDENRHHFRIAHETFSMAVFTSIRRFERVFLYLCVIFFAKIIDNTENFSNFVLGYHREYFCFVCLFCHYKDNKNFPNIQTFSGLYHCRLSYKIVMGRTKGRVSAYPELTYLITSILCKIEILFPCCRHYCWRCFAFAVLPPRPNRACATMGASTLWAII